MLELNLVQITGRVVATPELKHTGNGVSYTRFRIAVETGWGERKKTSFVSVTAWEKTAEFVAKYFDKGAAIYVQGSLEENTWEKDGSPQSVIRIIADRVQFAESTADADARRQKRGGDSREPATAKVSTDDDVSEDDLPF